MKKLIVSCLLMLAGVIHSEAQNAKVHVVIHHGSSKNYIYITQRLPTPQFFDKDYQVDEQSQTRKTTLEFTLKQPLSVTLYYSVQKGRSLSKSYNLYLRPGDDITLTADLQKPQNTIVVTGKGSENNQFLETTGDVDDEKIYGDTLPNRIIALINKQAAINRKQLQTYIARYHPSADFIKKQQYEVIYFAAEDYFGFKENNKFGIQKAYARNKALWQKVQDSLFITAGNQTRQLNKQLLAKTSLDINSISGIERGAILKQQNNDEALVATNYRSLLRSLLVRVKENLWNEAEENPDQFYREWYQTDKENGEKLFKDDRQNLLKEKIIKAYFKGQTAEFLYEVLLNQAKDESDPKNIPVIFNRFKEQYPQSNFIGTYEPYVAEIIKKDKSPLTDKMIFTAGNGTKLQKLDEVLALTKGKTVLVDMWGTWCGPCRQEIEKNSAAIKEHFKDKGLNYLYVANYDTGNQDNWKKLIAYFHLEGTHILASESLSDDIMKKVNGHGYPTYFIIKKDGSYEISKAGYPMKREVLVKQLEEALAMK